MDAQLELEAVRLAAAAVKAAGKSVRQIARERGVEPSTVSRSVAGRNTTEDRVRLAADAAGARSRCSTCGRGFLKKYRGWQEDARVQPWGRRA